MAGPATLPQELGELSLRRFSVEEYHRLVEAGILGEEDRVELLEGLLVKHMVRNPRHDLALSLSEETLARALPEEWFCRVQSAIVTEDSEPEPDLAAVRGPRRRYTDAHPGAADVALIVEVADASLGRDRVHKARLYAKAGIAQYWIINVVDGVVEVHEQPDPAAGGYAARTVVGRDGELVLRLPSGAITLRAADLLP